MAEKRTRPEVTEENVDCALSALVASLERRLRQKGRGAFASRHEILGAITEEYHELIEAVQSDEVMPLHDELLDVAVGALFGLASLKAGHLEW